MGALYQPVVNEELKPLIYAYDMDDAIEIMNRWHDKPENARIKLHEEQV